MPRDFHPRRVFVVKISGVGMLRLIARSSADALKKTLGYYAEDPFPDGLRITVKAERSKDRPRLPLVQP